MNEEIDEVEAFKRATEPFKMFMLKHTREKDLMLFMDASKPRKLKKQLMFLCRWLFHPL